MTARGRLRALDWLLLANLAVVTFEKIRWETSAATLNLSNLGASCFVAAFVVDRVAARDSRLPRPALTLAGFMLAFLAVYLAGYYDLQDHAALTFWVKGLFTWIAHFLFLICGVAHLLRRGAVLYMRGIAWFVYGILANAVYGIVQLVLAIGTGVNLDQVVVGRLTSGQGGTGGINVYGKIGGTQNVYRINALTGDPNHLGVVLCVPILLLLPLYLLNPRGRRPLGLVLLFLFVVQALTLSRSGALGDAVGIVVLAPLILPALPRLRYLTLGAAALAAAAAALYAGSYIVRRVIATRLSTSGSGTQTHLEFYRLVPPALDPHPLFGMGFNTFAVFYEFLTGRSDYGPHSFWVATLVETGMVGLCLYLAYFGYLLLNARVIVRIPDAVASRLGRGLLAALCGTAAANFFYLTMSFDYFFALVLLVIAGASIFASVERGAPAGYAVAASTAR